MADFLFTALWADLWTEAITTFYLFVSSIYLCHRKEQVVDQKGTFEIRSRQPGNKMYFYKRAQN